MLRLMTLGADVRDDDVRGFDVINEDARDVKHEDLFPQLMGMISHKNGDVRDDDVRVRMLGKMI